MNPFDLPGPQFLLFYWVTAVAIWLVLWMARTVNESGPLPRLRQMDPYLIAYLRGGAKEAIRVATFSLVDRGLLSADVSPGDKGPAKVTAAVSRVEPRAAVEGAILKRADGGVEAGAVLDDSSAQRACHTYAQQLSRLGLLPTAAHRAWRWGAFLAGGGILLTLAVLKILVGLARNRPVAFLVISAIVVTLITVSTTVGRHRTALGSRFLRDLRTLFADLKSRAVTLKPGGATDEAALLAAVFGVATLPAIQFPYASRLGPRGDSGSPSSCGSSCGGGDGGGGGCGGCGGGGGD